MLCDTHITSHLTKTLSDAISPSSSDLDGDDNGSPSAASVPSSPSPVNSQEKPVDTHAAALNVSAQDNAPALDMYVPSLAAFAIPSRPSWPSYRSLQSTPAPVNPTDVHSMYARLLCRPAVLDSTLHSARQRSIWEGSEIIFPLWMIGSSHITHIVSQYQLIVFFCFSNTALCPDKEGHQAPDDMKPDDQSIAPPATLQLKAETPKTVSVRRYVSCWELLHIRSPTFVWDRYTVAQVAPEDAVMQVDLQDDLLSDTYQDLSPIK